MTRHVRWIVAASVLSLATFAAAADKAQLARSDGAVVSIVGHASVGTAYQQLELRRPDGSLDTRFGRDGRVAFSLGRNSRGASAVRTDARGRLLVVGTVTAWDGRAVPSVLRFLADGQPDGSWGVRARSSTIVPDSDALGVDLSPQPDGSTVLLGQLEFAHGGQAALWRLDEHGRFDPGFGRSGVLRFGEVGRIEALGLQRDADGSMLVATSWRSRGARWLSTHRWRSGDVGEPRLVSRQAAPRDWTGPVALERRGEAWLWLAAGLPSREAIPMVTLGERAPIAEAGDDEETSHRSAETADASPGGALLNPFSAVVAPAPIVSDETANVPVPPVWIVVLFALPLAAFAWRRMRQPAAFDLGVLDTRRRQIDDAVRAISSASTVANVVARDEPPSPPMGAEHPGRPGCRNRLAAPGSCGPDELQRIKGIGPKLERLLHSEGIYHFWQIAQWDQFDVDFVSSRLPTFKGRVERDGWVRQARALVSPNHRAKADSSDARSLSGILSSRHSMTQRPIQPL